MKQYIANRFLWSNNVMVVEDGKTARRLEPHHEEVNHSPTGFEWGYAGSGPSQLGWALARDALEDEDGGLELARRAYQHVKWQLVAALPYDGWTIDAEAVKALAHDWGDA